MDWGLKSQEWKIKVRLDSRHRCSRKELGKSLTPVDVPGCLIEVTIHHYKR